MMMIWKPKEILFYLMNLLGIFSVAVFIIKSKNDSSLFSFSQSNPLTKTNSQQKMAEAIKEESSKIYYAPDEVDDVDDDDPDDDLNF